jgi:hypothetical protein
VSTARLRAGPSVEAIFYEDDLPEKWRDYYQANVDFFTTTWAHRACAKVGEVRLRRGHRVHCRHEPRGH